MCATTLAIAKFGSNATFSSTINALEVAKTAPNEAVNQNTSRLPMYAFNNLSSTNANNKAHAAKAPTMYATNFAHISVIGFGNCCTYLVAYLCAAFKRHLAK